MVALQDTPHAQKSRSWAHAYPNFNPTGPASSGDLELHLAGIQILQVSVRCEQGHSARSLHPYLISPISHLWINLAGDLTK